MVPSPGAGKSLANGTYTKGGIGEDCLNVNVYTPAGVSNTSGLPVVVWCEYLGWLSDARRGVGGVGSGEKEIGDQARRGGEWSGEKRS